MITIKPILYQITAFDASNDYIFKFSWNGNQNFKTVCEVRQNSTDDILYLETQETMQLQHTLPGGTLTNGTLYNVRIASVDVDGNVSDYSNPVLFYCYSTPIFKFDNISSNQIVKNSSYQVIMTYSQTENESLQSYEISLYNLSKIKIQTSGIIYSVDSLQYSLSDLEDNQSYYIRATGKTLNGMEIETDYIYFSVNYKQPSVYSVLSLENIFKNGYIKLQSNIRAIECHTNSDPIYINDEYINLSNDVLTIDKDFSLEDDFIINLSGYNISDGLIMQLSDGVSNINLYLRKGIYEINNNVEKTYIELNIPISFTSYQCFSNYIDNPNETDLLSFWFIRKNGLYQINLENKGEV